MKKTLIALAALATVSSSFAQSSVTISGFLHGSYDMFSIKNAGATRTGNKSENRVTDNSSRLIFGMVEDLGGGLSAVGQFDLRVGLDAQQRFAPDDKPGATSLNPASYAGTTGNNHVGLVSKDMGAIRLGRQDIHYTEGGHFNHTSTGTIASSINVLHSNGAAGGSIANWSRTPNLLWYTSPTIAGFSATLGTSTNGTRTSGGFMEQENDMASATAQRKGSTAYQRLAYTNGPLALVYSNINSKSDWIGSAAYSAGLINAAAQNRADQKGSVLTAKYTMSGFSVGYAAAQTSTTPVASTLVETKNSNNQLGLGYTTGKHNLAYTLTNKGDNKVAGVTVANTGAKQTSLVYGYDLSKRTSIGIAMVALTNEASSNNSLFYNAENAVGSYGSGALAGEKHTATAISLKHSF